MRFGYFCTLFRNRCFHVTTEILYLNNNIFTCNRVDFATPQGLDRSILSAVRQKSADCRQCWDMPWSSSFTVTGQVFGYKNDVHSLLSLFFVDSIECLTGGILIQQHVL